MAAGAERRSGVADWVILSLPGLIWGASYLFIADAFIGPAGNTRASEPDIPSVPITHRPNRAQSVAINRYDAPQINPGSERITQSATPDRRSAPAAIVVEFVSVRHARFSGKRFSGKKDKSITTQTKSHLESPDGLLFSNSKLRARKD